MILKEEFELMFKDAEEYEHPTEEDVYLLMTDKYVAKPNPTENELDYGKWLNNLNLDYLIKTYGIYYNEEKKYIILERAKGKTLDWYVKKIYLVNIFIESDDPFTYAYEKSHGEFIEYLGGIKHIEKVERLKEIYREIYRELYKIFRHIIYIIAELNSKYRFIHYDLHIGNIIVNKLGESKKYKYECYSNYYEINSEYEIKLIDYGYCFCPDLLQLEVEEEIGALFSGINIKVYDDIWDLSVFIYKFYSGLDINPPKIIADYLQKNGFRINNDIEGINIKGVIDEFDWFGAEGELQLELSGGKIDNSKNYHEYFYLLEKLGNVKYPLLLFPEKFSVIKEELERDYEKIQNNHELKYEYIKRFGSYFTFVRLNQVKTRSGTGKEFFDLINCYFDNVKML